MHVAHPFRVDHRGRTAEATEEAHLRHLIEQVLFTVPGERVNRPTFGSGLAHTVFAPWSAETRAAARFHVQASLQQWLGDRIRVDEVSVEADHEGVVILIRYAAKASTQIHTAEFRRKVEP